VCLLIRAGSSLRVCTHVLCVGGTAHPSGPVPPLPSFLSLSSSRVQRVGRAGASGDGSERADSERVTWHVVCHISSIADSSPEFLRRVCRLKEQLKGLCRLGELEWEGAQRDGRSGT
jgi:hypothetical protein